LQESISCVKNVGNNKWSIGGPNRHEWGRIAPTAEWDNTVLEATAGYSGRSISFYATLPTGEKEKEATKIKEQPGVTIGWVKEVIKRRMGIKYVIISLGKANKSQVDRSWEDQH
jgi:hypothetical protein